MSHTDYSEEAIRSIVAESLGRLFVVYSHDLYDTFSKSIKNGNELMKATLAKSVKYSGQKGTDETMVSM